MPIVGYICCSEYEEGSETNLLTYLNVLMNYLVCLRPVFTLLHRVSIDSRYYCSVKVIINIFSCHRERAAVVTDLG